MKRMTFHARTNRSGNLLHIETDGCVVNIRVGLSDSGGRAVTSVEIIPDRYAGTGGTWTLDGYSNNRVIQPLAGEDRAPGWTDRLAAQVDAAVNAPVTPDLPDADLYREARGWIADCEWGEYVDVAELTDAEVRAGIQRHYEGGWAAFVTASETITRER